MTERLTIRRPDDWHVHLRDGAMLEAVAGFTARQFSRAIVMPNLTPPVTTVAAASEYRERIRAALPDGPSFTPLMTCYLTDDADPDELARGFEEGVFTAAKLYPAHATTNSAHGVTDIANIHPALEAMQRVGMPLLVHGEVTDPDIDIFDREAVFIDRVMIPLPATNSAASAVVICSKTILSPGKSRTSPSNTRSMKAFSRSNTSTSGSVTSPWTRSGMPIRSIRERQPCRLRTSVIPCAALVVACAG